ncbi:MAG: PAS domain S-box protein [Bryobacterales bacterium]|nr:PAS domain S-box protein [Bryobacterales bacterium]
MGLTEQDVLQEHSRLTQAILHNATTALFIVDHHQQCAYMNPAAEALTGFSLGEVQGRSLHSLIHHTRRDGTPYPAAECPIAQVLLQNSRQTGEEVFVHKDGHFCDVAFTASPVRDGDGSIIGNVVEVKDITEQKRSEAERNRTERLLSAVLDALPVSILIADPQGRLLRMNQASEKIWGPVPLSGDISGYADWTGFHPSTGLRLAPEQWPLSRALLHREVTFHEPVEIQRFHSPERRMLELSAAPVTGDAGELLGGVVACLDVTERVRAEKSVRETAETLQTFYANAPFLMGITEPTAGDILHIYDNPAACLFFGLPPDGTHGRLATELGSPPEARAAWLEQYRRCAETNAPVRFEYEHDDGTGSRWLAATVIPMSHHPAVSVHRRFYYIAEDITSRKRAEEALRQSELRFRQLVEASPVGLVIGDTTGGLRYANATVQTMLGYTAEEFESGAIRWDHLTPPEFAPLDATAVHELLTHGVCQPYEKVYRASDGRHIPIYIGAARLPTPPGRQPDIAAFVIDITERKRAEEALRASEATLNAVLDSLPVGVIIADPQGRIVRDNAANRELWGIPPETTNWQQYGEWVGFWPDTGHRLQAHEWAMARALLHGQTTKGELVECQPFNTGPHRFFLNNAAPVRDPAGNIIAGVVAEMDVTEQRRWQQAVAASEIRFRQLADAMPQMVWTATPAGFVDYYNEQWFSFTGMRPDDAPLPDWTTLLHTEDAAPQRQAWRHSLDTGAPYAAECRLWDRHQHRWRWFIVRARPAFDAHHRVHKWFGTCTDIDEQKRTEQELRRANQDLEQFAYSASHDLQEPVRNVAISAQIFKHRFAGQYDAQADELLGYMEEGAKRIEQLLTDLLIYTESGTLQPPLHDVDCEQELAGVLTDLQQAIRDADAVVTHDPLPAIPVNALHIRQLFQNLIGNAIKYRRDDVPPSIHLSAEKQDSFWRFAVRDNGLGIEPEYHHKVFGLFKRLHARRSKYPGTGIGLALCQKVVERYGGRIWLESQLHAGSTFYFTASGHRPQGHLMNNTRILLAEDNPADVLLVRSALQRRNIDCDLHVVSDGAEALDYIAAIEQGSAPLPALLLLDLNLPKHTGSEVLAHLRQSPACSAVPVVIMTSSSSPRDQELVTQLGIARYFRKPTDLNQFMEIGDIVAALLLP